MDIRRHNRKAWDHGVDEGIRWTQPVDSDSVNRARQGKFEVHLTPTKPVANEWFPELFASHVLCLASAGGQQAPILAAVGAVVTVFDNSPNQLAQDRMVAKRDGLELNLVEGDMADLSAFENECFDLIFHPCSNAFVSDAIPVWQECFRVLRRGGLLLAGFTNPVRYIFDDERKENGNLEVRYSIPYSDLKDLPPADLKAILDSKQPLEFGHTLEDQIGGQLRAGFVLTGFYEDRYSDEDNDLLSGYLATFIATRALKL